MFDVIIPVFKTEPEYLREAVDSVLGQSFKDFQIFQRIFQRFSKIFKDFQRFSKNLSKILAPTNSHILVPTRD